MMEDEPTMVMVNGIRIWTYPAKQKPEWTPFPNSAGHISKEEWFNTWQQRMFNLGKHLRETNGEEYDEDQ